MRAATGSEPVRKAFEVGLVNLVEDRHHGLLDDLVLQCRDAQGALPPIGLRYVDSSRRLCPVRSTMHPTVQIGESFLLPFPCCLPHTVQSLGHALPALCRTHVRLNDVLLSLCPFLPSLRGSLRFSVRLVHGYYGTVRLLWYVHVRCLVYGLCGPVLFFRTRRTRDLPVLVHVVSQRARVLRLRRTEQPLAK